MNGAKRALTTSQGSEESEEEPESKRAKSLAAEVEWDGKAVQDQQWRTTGNSM